MRSVAMDKNHNFVYIYDMTMTRTFFDPGLWPMLYDYADLNKITDRWNFPSLAAPFWRVYWHNTTGAAMRIGRQTQPFRPDHLYLIPPKVDFSSIHHGHCRQFYVHFQIRHPYTLRGPPIIALPMTKQKQYFVRRIIAGHNADGIGRRQAALLIRALLETIIADLMDQCLLFRKIDPRLLGALNYLEGHLDQSLDNRKLATLMHAHPQTMLRIFKADLGSSPQAYLRQLRVDKACWLLRFSDEPIKAIAAATGFCDRYHFTKAFTALTGQSPARFRDYL